MRTRAATQVQIYNQIAIALGGIVTLIGLVVMIAWHFHLTALVQLLPGAAPMRYNTALTFLLSGLAITDRKQAEVAAQLSQERFRRAILDAPVPIMLHAEDGEVMQINRTWSELTGYSLEEIPTIAAWAQKAYGKKQELVLNFLAMSQYQMVR